MSRVSDSVEWPNVFLDRLVKIFSIYLIFDNNNIIGKAR